MDHYQLSRFVEAQATCYFRVLEELKVGRKQSHWMWFIFPQLKGLGYSDKANFYGVTSRAEARAYLDHPVLGLRLVEMLMLILSQRDLSAREIFGCPDELKFQSCVTLFGLADPKNDIYQQVLGQFYKGLPDSNTVELWEKLD